MKDKTTQDGKVGAGSLSDKQAVNGPKSNRALFITATLGMSWQLAVVVLVPIIGGYELDKLLKTSPALIILGFILAMAGTFAVMRKTLNQYGGQAITNSKGKQ